MSISGRQHCSWTYFFDLAELVNAAAKWRATSNKGQVGIPGQARMKGGSDWVLGQALANTHTPSKSWHRVAYLVGENPPTTEGRVWQGTAKHKTEPKPRCLASCYSKSIR